MKLKLLLSALFVFILLAACESEKQITVEDMEKIKLELIEQETSENGISYSIKLLNDSDYVIKQNNVFISFPIKQGENSYKGNVYKVQASGNKLNIEPGENIVLHVFTPFEGMGDKELLGTNNPHIQMIGYLQTVDEANQFSIGGSLHKN
ncbi:hypothetical protein [Solibacillus sp. FSL K6-1523]|uniref:hypothetical protein n=1 Tax=Solibacillus sp. FSL K6-1523 TaxID=2921471 RepID=UPI0030F812B7